MFTQTAEAIAGVAQVLTGQQKPSFKINAPVLFNNGATNVSTNVVCATLLPAQHRPCATWQTGAPFFFGLQRAWTTPRSGPPCLVELRA